MRQLPPRQRQLLLDIARSLEHFSSSLEKQAALLAHYGAMSPHIRALIVTAQSALDEAWAGVAEAVHEAASDDAAMDEHTKTLEIRLDPLVADEDLDN